MQAAATPDEGSGEQLEGDASQPGPSRHLKRRKVSAASFFADSDSEESEEEPDATKDELKEYLALPQIKHKLKSLYKSEQQVNNWWLQHREQFPNLEVMARQYLVVAPRHRHRSSGSSPR